MVSGDKELNLQIIFDFLFCTYIRVSKAPKRLIEPFVPKRPVNFSAMLLI